jgi:two-component system cell cycle response regulator DivK
MSTHHALIIDDNANNIEVLEGLLAEQGIFVYTSQDPTRVDAELQKLDGVDVVFCDLEMPKVDGFQLLPMLRRQLGSSVPIIAYTVHLSEIDTARKVGFDGFLGKPLDADRFPELLKRILNGQSIWELP